MHDLEEFAKSTVGPAEAVTLPPQYFVDPAIFEYEREHIFEKEWLCVGRTEQLRNAGDYFTVTLFDEPMVIVRGADMEIRALSSVCRHRGMLITTPGDGADGDWNHLDESSGNCGKTFKCPYHFWQYGHDGQLVQAPDMDRTPGFDPSAIRLPSFRCEIWLGFIFVNLDDNATPLAPRLEKAAALVKNWDFENLVSAPPLDLPGMPWNWKILHENSAEGYHVDRLHGPAHYVEPSAGVEVHEHEKGDAAITFGMRAIHPDFALNPTGKPFFPVLENLTEEERTVSLWVLIPPTLLIGTNSDSAFYRIMHPKAVDRTDIHQSYLTPPDYQANPLYDDLLAMSGDFHAALNRQDWMADAAIQRGMGSRHSARSRISWQEGPLVQLYSWLQERYLPEAGR
ncbi:aromatic ring-hydroxylating oxygenase subunit alpha [Amycolatopsis jejuensis]|uniref:aromatic ring-hydroxylating oxygenase subunit alpha n=1 Tax=Amycolatopsis jejuensis TaxID=330084 RepID=UPI000527CA9E|nr:aromatic ring-hydroxylating dioxygenase subunit alpha [Amycolatopsis jejuensis]